MTRNDIGFKEALSLVMNHVASIGEETVPATGAAGRVAAVDVHALANSPSVDVSFKDGYAVISTDIADASTDHPVKLAIVDHVAAGSQAVRGLRSGETIRILSGAPLPEGAQAVLTEEFTEKAGDFTYAHADANPGRNVLEKGMDVRIGQVLAKKGLRLTPQRIGLLIAGGVSEVTVFKKPKIGLLATGSEVIMPGQAMTPGAVYASNVVSQQAWLTMQGFEVNVRSAPDFQNQISDIMMELSSSCDLVITSGGAWKGERDLTTSVIADAGGSMVFHRVRLGPGKATGMGLLNNTPVFCLPGGPSSNMSGFVMIVLPAIYKMSGTDHCPHSVFKGTLETQITGQSDWANLVQCDILINGKEVILRPQKLRSRLWAMATHPAIVVIPEGVEKFEAGESVPFICLDLSPFSYRI